MVNEETVCVDELILQVFEDEASHSFFFPLQSQKEARSFVKVLHSKGVAYEDFCQEIDEFEHNFSAWRKGLGRAGIGHRVIERINGPVQEVIDSSDESEDDDDEDDYDDDGSEGVEEQEEPQHSPQSPVSSTNGVHDNVSRLRLGSSNSTTSNSAHQTVHHDYTESTVSSTANNTTIISLKKGTNSNRDPPPQSAPDTSPGNELAQSPLFRRQSFRTRKREGSESPQSPPSALSPKELSPQHEVRPTDHTSTDQGGSQPSSPFMQSKFQRAVTKSDNQPGSPFGSMRLRKTERLEALVNKSFTQEGSAPAKISSEPAGGPVTDRWSPQSSKQTSPEEPKPPSPSKKTEHKALRLTSTESSKATVQDKPAEKTKNLPVEKAKSPPPVTETKSASPEEEKPTISSLRLKLFGEEVKKKPIDENYNSDLDEEGMDVEEFKTLHKELRKVVNTHKPKAGHLYVLTDSLPKAAQQRVKVGGSLFPEKRLEQAQSFNLHMQMLVSLAVSDCKAAAADLQAEMEQYKTPGCDGWFKAPAEDIKKLAEKVAANYGDSDC